MQAPQSLPDPLAGSGTAGLDSQPLPPVTAEAFARCKSLFDAVCELQDARAVQDSL